MSSFLLLGAGTDASAGGGGANNIAANGSAVTASGTTSAALPALTTSSSNCVIVVTFSWNGSSIDPTVSDTAGLTWHLIISSTVGAHIGLWWALKPTAGATSITASNGAATFIEGIAQAFSGMNTTGPVDPSGAAQAATSPVVLTTTNANDALIVASRDSGGAAGAPTGFTNTAVATFTMMAYKIVTATQSSLSISDPATSNGIVAVGLMST